MWAIGKGEPWEPAWRSPDVYRGLQESIGPELAVLDLRVAPGDPAARGRGPELAVHLELASGLDQEQLDAVLARLARRWAADDRVATLGAVASEAQYTHHRLPRKGSLLRQSDCFGRGDIPSCGGGGGRGKTHSCGRGTNQGRFDWSRSGTG